LASGSPSQVSDDVDGPGVGELWPHQADAPALPGGAPALAGDSGITWVIPANDLASKVGRCAKGDYILSGRFEAFGLQGVRFEFYPNGEADYDDGDEDDLDEGCAFYVKLSTEDEEKARQGHATRMALKMFIGDYQFTARLPLGDGEWKPIVECEDVRKQLSSDGNLSLGLLELERLEDELRVISETRAEWRIQNWKKRLQMYDAGLALGWSDPFKLGELAGLQLDVYPNGDGSSAASQLGGPSINLHCGNPAFGYVLFVGEEMQAGASTGGTTEVTHHFGPVAPKSGTETPEENSPLVVGVEILLHEMDA